MTTPLPPYNNFDNGLPPNSGGTTQGQFKTALQNLLNWAAGLFGSDGTSATALSTLGAASSSALTSETNRAEAAESSLQTQINNLPSALSRPYNLRGNWSSSTAYAVNDASIDPNNMLYVCYSAVGPSSSAPDADSAHWYLAQGITFPQLASSSGAGYVGTADGMNGQTALNLRARTLWVNPATGNDANPGTQASPFHAHRRLRRGRRRNHDPPGAWGGAEGVLRSRRHHRRVDRRRPRQ